MTEKTTHGTELFNAVAQAMSKVQKIGRGDRNKFDGYNFASIDAFLELVNPICAECGLFVQMQEADILEFSKQGKSGESAWMRVAYDITLTHVSGASLPPVRRSVEVLRNGAQAFGSAQSYALKQFWRSLLLIPTGDKDDADHGATEAGRISSNEPRRPATPPKGPDPVALDKARAELSAAPTLAALQNVWRGLPPDIALDGEVAAAKDVRKSQLQLDDEIPDFDKPEIPNQ